MPALESAEMSLLKFILFKYTQLYNLLRATINEVTLKTT